MEFRQGMWVMYKGRVGILHKISAENENGEFHLVDEKGLTTKFEVVKLSALSQAGYNDIPSERRPAQAFAKKLGYV